MGVKIIAVANSKPKYVHSLFLTKYSGIKYTLFK